MRHAYASTSCSHTPPNRSSQGSDQALESGWCPAQHVSPILHLFGTASPAGDARRALGCIACREPRQPAGPSTGAHPPALSHSVTLRHPPTHACSSLIMLYGALTMKGSKTGRAVHEQQARRCGRQEEVRLFEAERQLAVWCGPSQCGGLPAAPLQRAPSPVGTCLPLLPTRRCGCSAQTTVAAGRPACAATQLRARTGEGAWACRGGKSNGATMCLSLGGDVAARHAGS